MNAALTWKPENDGNSLRLAVSNAKGPVKGRQADIGEGWWGKLYEEHGRMLSLKLGNRPIDLEPKL